MKASTTTLVPAAQVGFETAGNGLVGKIRRAWSAFLSTPHGCELTAGWAMEETDPRDSGETRPSRSV